MVQLPPEVFVIRIWLEQTSGASSSSRRGYVEHVATGQRRYFIALNDAFEFIESLGGMPPSRASG
jgi:hypothetical protein